MTTELPPRQDIWASNAQLRDIMSLANWLLTAAAVFALPAIWSATLILWQDGLSELSELDRWVPCTLLVAVVYTGLACYLKQLPYRIASQFVATFGMFTATLLTAALAFCFYSRVDHPLVNWLDAADELLQGTAPLWCLAALIVTLWITLRAGWLARH